MSMSKSKSRAVAAVYNRRTFRRHRAPLRFRDSELHRKIDGGDHAVRSRESFSGNFKRSAVIGAGPREGETQRHVHTFVKGMQLQWDQSLIVIHAKHRIEFAFNRAVKNCVGRNWADKNRGLPAAAGKLIADCGL